MGEMRNPAGACMVHYLVLLRYIDKKCKRFKKITTIYIKFDIYLLCINIALLLLIFQESSAAYL